MIELATAVRYGLSGLWVESYGQLHTDIYGLSSAVAIWASPADAMSYPSMLTPHPLWGFLHLERRTVSVEYGHCRTTAEYAGFEGTPVPVIEWGSGVNEEPIQTHPDFESFAGKPSAPLNGARFVDPTTNKITTNDDLGVFDKFWSNPPNKWAGVTSYLMPVVIKKITTIAPSPIDISRVGKLEDGYLISNASSTQRGIVFQNVIEFRGPGQRGWNEELYPG
jgi:hypothetical protein